MTRIDPGVVSLVAELRGHEQQTAEESERWKTHHEERKVIEASPAAIRLALLLTDEELDSVKCCGLFNGPRAPGSTFRRHDRPRDQQQRALQKRWDRLRAGLDLILQQRGADVVDLPGGTSGLLYRDYKGKKADRLVTRADPGVVSLVAELRGHERQAAEELEQWKMHHEERRVIDAAGGDHARPAADRRGVGLVGEEGWRWRNREGRTIRYNSTRRRRLDLSPTTPPEHSAPRQVSRRSTTF